MRYDEAMFAHAPEPMSEAEQLFHHERVAYHEAGHAVVSIALGFGCTRIQMREMTKPNERTYYLGGICFTSKAAAKKVTVALRRGVYTPLLAKSAIVSAAGVAAELRYCRESGMPARTLGGSEGDHEAIDSIAKHLEMVGGRSRFAFCELAWRGARRMIEDRAIWGAVKELAWALQGACFEEEDTPHEYSSFDTFNGATVRAIVRRAYVVKRSDRVDNLST